MLQDLTSTQENLNSQVSQPNSHSSSIPPTITQPTYTSTTNQHHMIT